VRVALLSDVHANLPALDAVLADLGKRGAFDSIYHLGDLVGYAPWPNEVVALLRTRGISGVAGNYDSTVATDYKHCGCKYEDPLQEQLSHVSFDYTKKVVTPATRAQLLSLPFRMDVTESGGHLPGARLILVHGTPTLNTLYWTEDRPDSFCLQMAEHAGARAGDIIAFGHTHIPWRREVEGIHFLNTGSVGRPKDGDARAGYVMVDFAKDRAPTIEFVRVGYDIERTANGIIEAGLPPEFAQYIRTGGILK
jgi:putative phosphoesterase